MSNVGKENCGVEYTVSWLSQARRILIEDPKDPLLDLTDRNYSGGLRNWELPINQIYFEPNASLEEFLLRQQVHEILLVALENAFREAEKQNYDGTWSAWKGMYAAEAYRLAGMVVHVDPSSSCAIKIRLNRLCRRMGKTLHDLVERGFDSFIGEASTSMKW